MKKIALSLILLVALLLAACSSPTEAPAPTTNETQVAESVNATLTAGAPPPTEAPPPTQAPTEVPPTPTEAAPTPTLQPIEGDPASVLGKPDGMDTFDSANNWTLYDNQCFKSQITDGKFVMESKGLQDVACWEVSWPQIQNFYYQSEVYTPEQCQPDDRFGLFFRAPDNFRGYLYSLTCDGRYMLTSWDGETTEVLIPATSNPAIITGPGSLNRIGVIAYGSNYMLYANGIYLNQVNDVRYSGIGKIGYFVRASSDQGYVVNYDNLAVWLLTDQYYPPDAPPPPNSGELPPPESGVPTVTTITYVNVRSGPGLNYPIYFVAPPASTGEAVGVSADYLWYAIKVPTTITGSGTAWISADYVIPQNTENLPVMAAPAPPPDVPVPPPVTGAPTVTNFEPLNVREGPGTQYASYGVAPVGSTASVLGISQDGQWYVVQISTSVSPDGTGWVNVNYVVLSNPTGATIPVVTNPEELPPVAPPPPSGDVPIATSFDVINVRTGPSTSCESYGVAQNGASAVALGVNADGTWYVVQIPTDIAPDGMGWVNANYVTVTNGENLPVMQSDICP